MSVRLDRALALLLASAGYRKAGLPILMYHSVSAVDDERSHPYFRTNTRPERFAEHMQCLTDLGYVAMDLQEAITRLGAGDLPERSVVITFDDGYEDFLTGAWPALNRHGFPATVFLPTAFIGASSRRFCDRPMLTWDGVRELRRAGIRFGSHTVNHPELVRVSADALQKELTDSRRTLEDELGEPVTRFAYPYAFPEEPSAFVDRLKRSLREAGYELGVTTRIGTVVAGDDVLIMKRLPINSDDDASLFTAKLNGAYNWLALVQRMVKRIKRTRRSATQEVDE